MFFPPEWSKVLKLKCWWIIELYPAYLLQYSPPIKIPKTIIYLCYTLWYASITYIYVLNNVVCLVRCAFSHLLIYYIRFLRSDWPEVAHWENRGIPFISFWIIIKRMPESLFEVKRKTELNKKEGWKQTNKTLRILV